METLENSERHWPARRKHMFFQIFMAQHICRDAVEIHDKIYDVLRAYRYGCAE